jgi:hypothetical protein
MRATLDERPASASKLVGAARHRRRRRDHLGHDGGMNWQGQILVQRAFSFDVSWTVRPPRA